jgi:hypothetical protein
MNNTEELLIYQFRNQIADRIYTEISNHLGDQVNQVSTRVNTEISKQLYGYLMVQLSIDVAQQVKEELKSHE